MNAGPNPLMLTRGALGVGVKFRVILLMLMLMPLGALMKQKACQGHSCLCQRRTRTDQVEHWEVRVLPCAVQQILEVFA